VPTAYLSPSQLQDLTNVSSTAPGSGDNGKALVWNWNSTTGTGQWQAQQVAYSSLSGAPSLGTMAAQNANAVAITGGTLSGLGSAAISPANPQTIAISVLNSESPFLSQSNTSFTSFTTEVYNSDFDYSYAGFEGRRARGSISNPSGVQSGDWIFAFSSRPRGFSGWSAGGASLIFTALTTAASGNPDNRVAMAADWYLIPTTLDSTPLVYRMTAATFINYATTPSTSPSTGAMTVAGGVGIQGALHVGGQINGLGAVQPGTPASHTAAGTAGQVRWDDNYIYVCTATNTWKRVAISTW